MQLVIRSVSYEELKGKSNLINWFLRGIYEAEWGRNWIKCILPLKNITTAYRGDIFGCYSVVILFSNDELSACDGSDTHTHSHINLIFPKCSANLHCHPCNHVNTLKALSCFIHRLLRYNAPPSLYQIPCHLLTTWPTRLRPTVAMVTLACSQPISRERLPTLTPPPLTACTASQTTSSTLRWGHHMNKIIPERCGRMCYPLKLGNECFYHLFF